MFQVSFEKLFVTNAFQVLSKGSFYLFKNNDRFPRGLPKKKIQQWRQAQSRPGEKETLDIMLRELKI